MTSIRVRAASALAYALVLVPLLAGCGGKTAVRDEGTAAGPAPVAPRVAVAPMENRSNDLDASEIVRNAFAEQIAAQGWNVIPTDESDRLLRERLGSSYGGQLAATTPAEVCGAVGAEGVFYGEIQEWLKTTAGVYNSAAVAASFRLYRKDGTVAWEGKDRQERQMMPRGGGGSIGGEILGYAILNLVSPVSPLGKEVGRRIGRQLPPGALGTK